MRWGLVLASLFVLGCQRVADEPADYGPEVSRAEINRALAHAMAGITSAARVGTSLTYHSRREVGDAGDAADLGSTSITVGDEELTPNHQRRLRLNVERRTRGEGGEFKASRREEYLTLGVVEAHAAPTLPRARVTYHRLRTADETLPAPAAVRARPACGGLAECALHVRYVIFDLVTAPEDGGELRKTTLTLGFSAQTPYVPHGEGFERFDGALVIECRASRVRLATRHTLVRDCRTLADFER